MSPYTEFLPNELQPLLLPDVTLGIDNMGMSGETTAEIKARAVYSGYDVAILLAGTNDISFQRLSVEEIWQNLLEMYTKFEEAQTAIIVAVTVPRIRQENLPEWLATRRNELNEKITAWVKCKPEQRVLVDLHGEISPDEKALWARDGLHLSVDGYKRFASLVARSLAASPVIVARGCLKSNT